MTLEAYFQAHSLVKATVAKAIGMNPSQLNACLKGRERLPDKYLWDLSQYLKLSLEKVRKMRDFK